MQIITNYMTKHGLYDVKDIAPKGIFLHSVGCAVDKAEKWWSRWNKPSYESASVHGFIDDEKAIIALPCMEKKGVARKSFHVAVNSTHERYLSFEMCEYGGIRYTGGSSWDHSNEAEVIAYAKKTYANAVILFAELCKFHGWDPLADGVILSHYEGYKRGIASGHGDPEHIWKYAGLTMDGFRKDVAAAMNNSAPTATIKPNETTTVTAPSSQLYRVRKTWDDSKSQLGAYKNLDSAKDLADKNPGYSVFDESGNAVYTPSTTPTTQMYRVRKTWEDSKSQKGAYKDLNNAKIECDKHEGYSVFDESGKAVYTSPINAVIPNITYAVKTKAHGILPDVKNRTDCAGYGNSEIVAIKIGVDVGSVKYRVHTVNGKWLSYVTGANWNDFNNGYAGDDAIAIDAIEVIYNTDTNKTGGKYYKVKYQVKAKGNSSYWSNQYDNEKTNGQDGYAGSFGSPIVEVKMNLE